MTPQTPVPSQPHLQYWNSGAAVDQYAFDKRPPYLFFPEIRLLGLLRDRWPSLHMLDIGVGAGRTTQYFAELASKYVGIDFAASMISACVRRFAGRWPGAEFKVGDACQLTDHSDNSYDLVLFSFNGIDNLPYEKREQALAEMKRVCKPDGWVVFSSHSIYSLPSRRRFAFKAHPVRLREEIIRWWKVHRHNPAFAEVMAKPYVQYCDGNTGNATQMFIRPEVQVADVQRAGMEVIGRFAGDGRTLSTDEEARSGDVAWVYYFCRKL